MGESSLLTSTMTGTRGLIRSGSMMLYLEIGTTRSQSDFDAHFVTVLLHYMQIPILVGALGM